MTHWIAIALCFGEGRANVHAPGFARTNIYTPVFEDPFVFQCKKNINIHTSGFARTNTETSGFAHSNTYTPGFEALTDFL